MRLYSYACAMRLRLRLFPYACAMRLEVVVRFSFPSPTLYYYHTWPKERKSDPTGWLPPLCRIT